MVASDLKKSVCKLGLSCELVNKLSLLNVLTVEDLWHSEKIYLKRNNITDQEISSIKIKLQLLCLDLNGKVYDKN